jgi:hypothetical protein
MERSRVCKFLVISIIRPLGRTGSAQSMRRLRRGQHHCKAHRESLCDREGKQSDMTRCDPFTGLLYCGVSSTDPPGFVCTNSKPCCMSGTQEMGLLIRLDCLGANEVLAAIGTARESRFEQSIETPSRRCWGDREKMSRRGNKKE